MMEVDDVSSCNSPIKEIAVNDSCPHLIRLRYKLRLYIPFNTISNRNGIEFPNSCGVTFALLVFLEIARCAEDFISFLSLSLFFSSSLIYYYYIFSFFVCAKLYRDFADYYVIEIFFCLFKRS